MRTRCTIYRASALLTGIIAATAIAACGSGTAPTTQDSLLRGAAAASAAGIPFGHGLGAGPAPRAKLPCSLITRAEAETALGGPATGDPKQDRDSCTYNGGGTDGSDSVTLTLGSPEEMKTLVTGNGVGGTLVTEPVNGVGDEAIFQRGEEILYVRRGTDAFAVQVVTLAGVQGNISQRDATVAVAHAVLGRL